jgi:predicted NBD/HSP70 family sugar kinase
MAFTQSDLDLAVPMALRAILAGWEPDGLRTADDIVARSAASPGQAEAMLDALVGAGLARREAGRLRRLEPPVRLFAADLGGTKLHAAIVDEAGRLLAERLEPTAVGAAAVIDQIAELRDALTAEAGLSSVDILSSALGVPGAVDPRSGRVALATNIVGLDAVDVAASLATRLGHPVRLENDVNLAALGEAAIGSARGVRDFAFISLGTGVGMGLVSDGRLLRGRRGMAGEIAMLPARAPGEASAREVALEELIGNSGILAAARRAGSTQATTVKKLFDEARSGGGAASAALNATAQTLIKAVQAVCAIVDPELVVLGGSIGMQPEIAGQLAEWAAAQAHAPRIAQSTLGGRAVLAGASLAALAQLVAGPSHTERKTTPMPHG